MPASEGDDAVQKLRLLGNEAFKAGRYQEAFDSYTQALSIDRSDPRLFSNRSATCLKLNVPLQAFRDGFYALTLLRSGDGAVDSAWTRALAKTLLLLGTASLLLGEGCSACRRLRMYLKLLPDDATALQKLREAVALLSSTHLVHFAATLISGGEMPTAYSTREGRYMKLLPEGARFSYNGLVQHLQDALVGRERLVRAAVYAHFSAPDPSAVPARHLLYAFRSIALLRAQQPALALKDARAAIAFMPEHGCAFTLCTHADALDAVAAGQQEATVDMQCGAMTVRVKLRTAAAISLFRASKLDRECSDSAVLSIGRLSELHAQVLQDGGVDALLLRLKQEHEALQPDFKRGQPKYAAYFEWMTQRLAARFPELDQASRDKLLCMDSGELDLLLQPANAHLDAAALLEAADSGLNWRTFQAVTQGTAAHVAQLSTQ